MLSAFVIAFNASLWKATGWHALTEVRRKGVGESGTTMPNLRDVPLGRWALARPARKRTETFATPFRFQRQGVPPCRAPAEDAGVGVAAVVGGR